MAMKKDGSCYRERANDNVTGTAVVTTTLGDAYFQTHRLRRLEEDRLGTA